MDTNPSLSQSQPNRRIPPTTVPGGPLPSELLEALFASFPDALVICDREGHVLRLNAAARRLFELPSERHWLGKTVREVFGRYLLTDEQYRGIALSSWVENLPHDERAPEGAGEHSMLLSVPSGWTFSLDLRCWQLMDAQEQPVGTAFVFHEVNQRSQQALHHQRVQQAVQTLTTALGQIPADMDWTFSEDTPLLSPAVLFVAKPLVEVIRQVLQCWRVSLAALGSESRRLHYAIGSGFTTEQEEEHRRIAGRFTFDDLGNPTIYEQLSADQEVIVSTDRLHLPEGFPLDLVEPATLLVVPWVLQQRLIGGLVVYKAGWDRGYSQQEVDLVREVAAHALLIVQYLTCLHRWTTTQVRTLVQRELDHLSQQFLILASHELRTPLTGIKGNVQLAQRRFDKLMRLMAEPDALLKEQMARAQQPLADALASARLQERLLQEMIDLARLQASTLPLSLKLCDLLPLLKAAVTSQQLINPGRTIRLLQPETAQQILVLADAERMTQVLTICLATMLTRSAVEQPVTVQLSVEHGEARILIHDEEASLAKEVQERLWDRFFRSKGDGMHKEVDLMGLSFFLCQALMERHQGRVGVHSDIGQGTTFSLTLPCLASRSVPSPARTER